MIRKNRERKKESSWHISFSIPSPLYIAAVQSHPPHEMPTLLFLSKGCQRTARRCPSCKVIHFRVRNSQEKQVEMSWSSAYILRDCGCGVARENGCAQLCDTRVTVKSADIQVERMSPPRPTQLCAWILHIPWLADMYICRLDSFYS